MLHKPGLTREYLIKYGDFQGSNCILKAYCSWEHVEWVDLSILIVHQFEM